MRRFLKRHLKVPEGVKDYSDWVDFKVLHREYYDKRYWVWSRHLRVEVHVRGGTATYEVVDFGREFFDKMEERKFSSLDEAVKHVLEKYPPKYYVYYKPVFREFDESFTNVRYLFGFTVDEAEAWKTILARTMGHLNGRVLLGFRKLRETSKECDQCWKEKAAVQLVFDYHGKKYSVYYCRECFIKRVYSLWANLLKEVGRIKDRMLNLVEPPISDEEKRELEEYLAKELEDLNYMKELGLLNEENEDGD